MLCLGPVIPRGILLDDVYVNSPVLFLFPYFLSSKRWCQYYLDLTEIKAYGNTRLYLANEGVVQCLRLDWSTHKFPGTLVCWLIFYHFRTSPFMVSSKVQVHHRTLLLSNVSGDWLNALQITHLHTLHYFVQRIVNWPPESTALCSKSACLGGLLQWLVQGKCRTGSLRAVVDITHFWCATR